VTDIVEAVVLEDLPLGGSPSGWCQDALDNAEYLDVRETARLHGDCFGALGAIEWPDPGRKGATYILPGRRCPCVCHTRPLA
jgi:hypothetical protein